MKPMALLRIMGLGVFLGLATLALPQLAHAGGVHVSFGFELPVPVVVAPPPVYVQPAPVVVAPPPVYVQPAPVVVAPPPVVVPQPQVVYTQPYYRVHQRYWRHHHNDEDED